MYWKFTIGLASLGATILLGAAVALGQTEPATVPIGNPGNVADSNGYGAVPYSYRIMTYEVTSSQYAAFLNAVAATDTHGLYNAENMPGGCGIWRSGSSGSYTYSVAPGSEQRPVAYVSFYDACRFANWMHNCQPAGPQGATTTESGAYDLTSGEPVIRSAGWRWAVASEDEWYKAAYHQPASLGGDNDGYWRYPTSSNVASAQQMNCCNSVGWSMPVGSYSANFYGTFDMGGNVAELTEPVCQSSDPTRSRVTRGGAFYGTDGAYSNQSGSDIRHCSGPNFETGLTGFRLVRVLQFPPPPCSGDVTGDGVVNTSDLVALLGVFGQPVSAQSPFDFFRDGVVNTIDLTIFLSYFGGSCPAGCGR